MKKLIYKLINMLTQRLHHKRKISKKKFFNYHKIKIFILIKFIIKVDIL